MHRVLSIVLLFSIVFAKHEIYDGHTLYEINVVNDVDQTEFLNDLKIPLNIDVWSYPRHGLPGEVLVPKEQKQKFQDTLNAAGIEHKVKVENIKESLELEEKLLAEASSKSPRSRLGGISLDTVHDYETVDAYLEELAAAYPDVVTLVHAGRSFEGRAIKYLKISSTNFQDTTKPIVFMESLLHAREWITLPPTLYAIEKLVIDVQEQDLIQDIDWIILPIANPDGYVHSHETNRFWRKNRATGYMIGDVCVGVDLNRNFDIHWSQHSSNNVCSDTFHGRGPFSEPETAILHEIFRENIDRMAMFLDIHSFGSMILYGFGNGTLPSNGLILHVGGIQMSTAIDAVKLYFNPIYRVGNVASVLYLASGIAGDYAQSVGVPLSYTYELPAHRSSAGTLNGFLVNPELLEQFAYETWQGIKAGARFARSNHLMRRGL